MNIKTSYLSLAVFNVIKQEDNLLKILSKKSFSIEILLLIMYQELGLNIFWHYSDTGICHAKTAVVFMCSPDFMFWKLDP